MRRWHKGADPVYEGEVLVPWVECPACVGTGYVEAAKCAQCGGRKGGSEKMLGLAA